MQDEMLWQTKRETVTKAYEGMGPFEVATKPYHSTRTLRIDVVGADGTNGFALGVARPQTMEFFAYGVGDNVLFGAVQRIANDADTNLAKSRSTNGAADMVIEGIGFHCRGFRGVDAGTGVGFEEFPGGTDPDVVAALDGGRPILDPASMFFPAQVYSPFNLENAIFNGLAPFLSVELEWDRRKVEKLGTVDLFPQAGAASGLRAHGEPHTNNRYWCKEGYLWRRDGQPDSELIVRVRLEEALVIPLTLSDDPEGTAEFILQSRIDVDMVCRLFGFEFELPSGN